MEIISTNRLTTKQFQDAKTLIELCRLEDKTRGVCFLDNDVNLWEDFPCFYLAYENNILIAFLGVFIPSEEECEIYAHTMPKYRQKGLFRKLFCMAFEQIKEYGLQRVYFAIEPGCEAGKKALEKLGAVHETSEYLMSYNMNLEPKPRGILELEVWDEEEILHMETFKGEKKVGEVSAEIQQNVATIFGVEVVKEMRGRGYGVETLLLAIEELKRRGCCKIILHVSGSNEIAHRMYANHGFVHAQQLDYWVLTTDIQQ